jgi:4-amino-4-deoxy-L-arabinose transferase-like glycosyltransferase
LQSSTRHKRGWILLFLAIAAFYFYGLGAFPLVGPDEPRYAEVAREMLARHDLITPTLGGLPWFEKPSLLYWLIMASYRVLGVSEYTARLGAAVCALITGFSVFWMARQVEAEETSAASSDSESRPSDFSLWSTLIFLSSAATIVFARGASFDIVVTMAITLALACFFKWHGGTAGDGEIANAAKNAPWPAKVALAGFFFFIGVALLAKGLIGIILPFGVIGFYFILRWEWPARKFLLSLLWGLPLAIAVAAIWYAPMIARHGWTFIDQFIIQHHFARFITTKYHHTQPFYFYLLVLPLLALPWTILFVSALTGARRWVWRGDTPRDRVRVFALAWILMPAIFFSLSESKLPAYILPALPAVSLLVGDRLMNWFSSARSIRLTGALLIALAASGGYYAFRSIGLTSVCITLLLSPILISGAIALFTSRPSRLSVLAIAIGTLSACAIVIRCSAPFVAQRYSVRGLLETATSRGYGSAPVVQLYPVERTAEFYAAGRLTYGPDGQPIEFESIGQVADAARRGNGPVLVIVPVEYEGQLTNPRIPLRAEIIGDNSRVALVVVRLPE